MSIKFEFLPHDGEAILVTVKDDNGLKSTTLIDGGYHHPFGDEYEGEIPNIDNIIVTHVDNDHIKGIIEFLKYPENIKHIQKIIFNEPKSSKLFSFISKGYTTSYRQGSKLCQIISPHKAEIHFNDVCCTHNNIIEIDKHTTLKIISPTQQTLIDLHEKWNKDDFKNGLPGYTTSYSTNIAAQKKSIDELAEVPYKPDSSLPNRSSLAFILEHKSYRFLLLGDAHIEQVIHQLNHLKEAEKDSLCFDFIKLSHHGSKHNINPEFLNLVYTNNFIICQAKETQNSLPDRESIAKIIKHGRTIDKNTPKSIYHTKSQTRSLKFTQEEMTSYNFNIIRKNKFYFGDA